jgi:hypothetical protein
MKRLLFQLEGLGEIFLGGRYDKWFGSTPHHTILFPTNPSGTNDTGKGVEFVPDVMEARRYGPYLLDSKSSRTILENFGVPEHP